MSAPNRKPTGVIVGAALALAAVALVVCVALFFVDLPRVAQVCSGEVVSTDLCEPARLGRSVFGSVLAGSGVIAAAIVGGAWMARGRGSADES